MEQYTEAELKQIETYAKWAGALHLTRKTRALLEGDQKTAEQETRP